MLEHFVECMKVSKGARLEALQINVYTALLFALRGVAEVKGALGQDGVIATDLVIVSCLNEFFILYYF